MDSTNIIPVIAIVDGNTLSAMGLKSLLGTLAPSALIEVYGSFNELESAQKSGKMIVHYFVADKIVFEHSSFFLPLSRRTIVLVCGATFIPDTRYMILDISQPEKELIKSILRIYDRGHSHSANMPDHMKYSESLLSRREKEVLRMVVMGFLNKEIADKFSISITTVISHRKNITRKLEIKSLSGLTIYAVTSGLIRLEEI